MHVVTNGLKMPTIPDLRDLSLKLLFLSVLELYVFGNNSTCENVTQVENVNACPSTEQGWRMAEVMKNCSSKVPSCHNVESWRYHCLRNHWLNETVQMCGRPQKINGYSCAEYNSGGDVIQANYEARCKQSTPPCPFQYPSDEVYKYTVCMETKIEEPSKTQNPSTTLSTLDPNEDKSPYLRKLPFLMMVAILIFFVLFCVIFRMHKKRRDLRPTLEVIFARDEN